MKNVLLGLMAVTASTAFAADAPYAKVVAVNGHVTVASKSQMQAASVGMPLVQGASVLPGSNAKATVLFASGCQANVGAGQALSVDEAACSALNAKAHTVQGSAGSTATGGDGLAGLPPGAQIGLVAGGTLGVLCATKKGICKDKKDKKNKPISGS